MRREGWIRQFSSCGSPSDSINSLQGKVMLVQSHSLAAAFLPLISLVLSTAMTAVAGRFTSALGLPEGIAGNANFSVGRIGRSSENANPGDVRGFRDRVAHAKKVFTRNAATMLHNAMITK